MLGKLKRLVANSPDLLKSLNDVAAQIKGGLMHSTNALRRKLNVYVKAAGILLLATSLFACSGPSGTSEPARPQYTRDQFQARIMGKSVDQVIASVGRPDTTQENSGQWYWYYSCSYDPITGRGDTHVQVVFTCCGRDGVVALVNF